MCLKAYKEVFQQFCQYDAFAVSTNKNTIKTRVQQAEVQESEVVNLTKIYELV